NPLIPVHSHRDRLPGLLAAQAFFGRPLGRPFGGNPGLHHPRSLGGRLLLFLVAGGAICCCSIVEFAVPTCQAGAGSQALIIPPPWVALLQSPREGEIKRGERRPVRRRPWIGLAGGAGTLAAGRWARASPRTAEARSQPPHSRLAELATA